MVQPPGPLPAPRKRHLLAWAGAGLLLLGLTLVLLWFAVLPAVALGRARIALRGADPKTARPLLERYLARWPNDGGALLLAARAARRADDCAAAERYLSAAEERSGATEASQLEWALLGAQQGDFAGNENRLREEVDRDPANAPWILEALARGYDVSYRYAEALEVLDRLTALAPDSAAGPLLRAQLQLRQRRQERAEEDLRRAVALAPESGRTHAALAGVLQTRGHTREALSHYRTARRLGAGGPSLQLGSARAHIDAAELDEAQEQLDELLAAHPGHVEGLVERGRLALRRTRAAEAEPFLTRATHEAPWHREGHELLLVTQKELGRPDEVKRCEARLAELKADDAAGGPLKLRARNNPGDVDVRWRLWLWSVRNGLVEEGVAWLTEILRRDPRHRQAHEALAEHFQKAGQPRRAALHRLAASGERAATKEKRP